MPFFDEMVQFGDSKAVCEFGTKIIYNEQITVDQIICFGADLFTFLVFAKPAFL